MPAAVKGVSQEKDLDRCERAYLVERTGSDVVDEAADLLDVGHEWAGPNARNGLADVLLGVGERLQRERRADARLGLDLGLQLVILEGDHAAVGVVDQDDL